MSPLALGLDLGSSGLRLALAASTPGGGVQLLCEQSAPYPRAFNDPIGWRDGLIALAAQLDPALRARVSAIAVAGTSGTLLCCRPDGEPLPGEAGLALPYHLSCPEQAEAAARLCGDPASPAASASGSLARALRLIAASGDGLEASPATDCGSAQPEGAAAGFIPLGCQGDPSSTQAAGPGPELTSHGGKTRVASGPHEEAIQRHDADSPGCAGDSGSLGAGRATGTTEEHAEGRPPQAEDLPCSASGHTGATPDVLLRHQADWLMGWLLGDWRWGEEGNNLRLGWDLRRQAWSGAIASQSWHTSLPRIRASGADLGPLSPAAAAQLGLPPNCRVVAGSTDANAGVLAADPREGDGITVLGTTLVLKQFVDTPISAPGVSCHRVAGRWLLGGASNAGAGILRRFFSDEQIAELSRQIDPRRPSDLDLLPLPARGERFPVDDPQLEPRLEPRPVSDALYLQALLEGLTAIERQGWQRLEQLGAPPLKRVISLGGGARNPQWRMLRQQALGVPVLQRPDLSAALGMALLALRTAGRMEGAAITDP